MRGTPSPITTVYFFGYISNISRSVPFRLRQVNGASVPGAKKENFELEFKVGRR